MRTQTALVGLLSLGAVVAVIAFITAEPAIDRSTPTGHVRAACSAARENDLTALMETMLPRARLRRLEERYQRRTAYDMSDSRRQQIDTLLAALHDPDQHGSLVLALRFAQGRVRRRIITWADAIDGLFTMATLDPLLTSDEREQAQAFATTLRAWAETVDLDDLDANTAAIEALRDATEAAGITSADDLDGLDFDQALALGDHGLQAIKDIALAYGLDIDATLDATVVEAATTRGDTAKVPLSVTLFGEVYDMAVILHRVDDRWIDAQTAALTRDVE